ncbi:MAG: hypothetical protein ACMV1B_01165 [Prevotella sp.]
MSINIEELRKAVNGYEPLYDFEPITGRILNLTQHSLTTAQVEQGGFEPSNEDKALIAKLLTVEKLISPQQLLEKALSLLEVASKYEFDYILVGGMHPLINILAFTSLYADVETCQAFSKRTVVEEKNMDGTVVKKTVFIHEKFYKFV